MVKSKQLKIKVRVRIEILFQEFYSQKTNCQQVEDF